MEVTQKRLTVKTRFEFGDEELTYSIEHKGSKGSFKVKYAEIPPPASQLLERQEWLRNIGVIWVVLGLFFMFRAYVNGASLSGQGFWPMLGVFCLIAYQATLVRLTVFKTGHGLLCVIQDKRYKQIVGEITSRKNAQLIKLFGEINRENDPEMEVRKFNWLREQGALTEEEAEKKIEQVRWIAKN